MEFKTDITFDSKNYSKSSLDEFDKKVNTLWKVYNSTFYKGRILLLFDYQWKYFKDTGKEYFCIKTQFTPTEDQIKQILKMPHILESLE